MFTVIKRMEISAAHKLILPYRSKCASLHGHNWIITVYCRSERLNADGMVVDFTQIKQAVKEKLDHRNLNEVLIYATFGKIKRSRYAPKSSHCCSCGAQCFIAFSS
jgi:6-pyruvoyl tetrahydropterin synthase/QueD family protein